MCKYFVSLLFFVSILSNTSFGQCDALLKEVEAKFMARDYEATVRKCTEQINACPNNPTYLFRGLCYYALNNKDAARRDFRLAAEKSDNKAGMFNEIGEGLFRKKRYADAFELYEQASQADPSIANVWFKMGRCKWLAHVLVMQKQNVLDYSKDSVLNSGLKKEIAGYYAKAIEQDSIQNYQTYQARKQNIMEAIKDTSGSYLYYFDKGMFEINFAEYTEALHDFEMANLVHPTIKGYEYAAAIARKIGDKEKACAYMSKWATMFDLNEVFEPERKKAIAEKFCKELYGQ